jgi:2-deoxy-D-gluconate 3-dehydrogenase
MQEEPMKELFSLEGKVAIVTGGNGGIGKRIAGGLAGMGADIVIAARNQDKTAGAVSEIKEAFGVRVFGIQFDLVKAESIQDMVNQTLDRFDRIDILVNNAGINIRKMPQDYTVSEWDDMLDANLRGSFLCSQAVYPAMKKAGGGKIINIGSMTCILGGAKLVPYGASKGGIVTMMRNLAVAWAPDNIQINAILPGWIDTKLTRQARKDIPGLAEGVESRTPMGRWGDPKDLIGAAIFLASPASDFVTGVSLRVDGGFSISML